MTQKTKNDENTNAALPRFAWLFAALIGGFAYFFGLTLPFVGPDEPRYAQVAREMMDRGDWITPTLGGAHWFEKPALLYWLEIVAYKAFGVSEFAARLGPALFGIGTVMALWMFGRFVLPGTPFAKWVGLLAASTLGIFVFAHGASFDIIVTFPLSAALVSFFIFDRRCDQGEQAALPLVLFYIFIGIALLAKGLIGIAFPLGTVALYYLLGRRMPSGRFLFSLLWGTAVFCAVAAIWYLPVYTRNGMEFIDAFIIQHHFQRFISNKYQHPQPFYFFLWVLPLMTLPWLPMFVVGLWQRFRHLGGRFRGSAKGAANEGDGFSSSALFALCWMLVPLVLFSISGSKLPGYILPAVPGAVIISAIFAYRMVTNSRGSAWAVYSTACLVFGISVLLLATVAPRFASSESVRDLFAAAGARGLSGDKVFSMHTISHSAEFYAAGRLLRDPQGQQKKLYSPAEVVTEMERSGVDHALVLVPTEYAGQLTGYPALRSEVVSGNGELDLIAAARK